MLWPESWYWRQELLGLSWEMSKTYAFESAQVATSLRKIIEEERRS